MIDELASFNNQELVLVFDNIKPYLEKTVPERSRSKTWNIAALQREFTNGILINAQNDDYFIYMFLFCGHASFFRKGAQVCSENGLRGEEELFTIYSVDVGTERQVVCSDLNKFSFDSVEYKQLDFLCRDRSISITTFQLVLLLVCILLFLISIGCCLYMSRLKPSDLTI